MTFHDYKKSFAGLASPNLTIFLEQVKALRTFLIKGTPTEAQSKNMDYMLQLGELFSLIPYAQLICESRRHSPVSAALMEEVYKFIVTDFSKYAVRFYCGQQNDDNQSELILKMVRKPRQDSANFEQVWTDEVYALKGAYAGAATAAKPR